MAQLGAVAILTGGAVGALARAGLAEAFPAQAGEWPWGTFVANQLGALLLAWLATELTEVVVPTRFWRPLLGTGFCGALTTFSAFQVELLGMLDADRAGLALTYAAASLAAGGLAVAAATNLSRRAV